MSKYKKKTSSLKVIFLTLIFGTLISVWYLYNNPKLERIPPTITINQNIFWNKIEPIKIKINDNQGLKKYKISLSDGVNTLVIKNEILIKPSVEEVIHINYPNNDNSLDTKSKKLTLNIEVIDNSMWNFFEGNIVNASTNIIVDNTVPNINILSNSYSITQGGAALVIFHATDDNLEELYVEACDNKFKAQPYKKEGYYAALIAWPFKEQSFDARIIAMDKANNSQSVPIDFYIKNHKYKTSWIKAKDKFIDGKISQLAKNDTEYSHINNRLDKLKAVNETMRLKNEDLIHSLSSNISNNLLQSWKMNKFYPLKNAQKVASHGDERHYYYKTKDNVVSHSYHVGYDLASTKMAIIKSSNPGKVVYADYNGIYGNMPMIDHGLGLYTLYGHCSQLLVKNGDNITKGQAIAKTGASGLALGDHLHFGILVQGIEVRPIEWFDQSWIRKNIDLIFSNADKIINQK